MATEGKVLVLDSDGQEVADVVSAEPDQGAHGTSRPRLRNVYGDTRWGS